MPYYEWVGNGQFNDNRNDRVLDPGDVVELPEHHAQRFDFVEADDPEANPQGSDGETIEEVPLEEKDYSELRDMAVEADTDEINGRSSTDEIVAYFSEE